MKRALFLGLFSMSALVLLALMLSSAIPPSEAAVDLLDRDDLCDVCEIVVDELEQELAKTKRSKSILSTGYSIDAKGDMKAKNRIAFKNSEVRLIEALEKICDAPMDKYRTNYWNKDLPKFIKRTGTGKNEETAEMFQVDSAEADSAAGLLLNVREQLLNQFGHMTEDHNELRVACSQIVERFEDEIQDWFRNYQDDKRLKEHLCVLHLRNEERIPCYYSDIEISKQFLIEDTKLADMDEEEEQEVEQQVDDFYNGQNEAEYLSPEEQEERKRAKLDASEGKFASKLDKLVPAGPVDYDEEAEEQASQPSSQQQAAAPASKGYTDQEAQAIVDKYTATIRSLRLAYDSMVAVKSLKEGSSDMYSKIDHSEIDGILNKDAIKDNPDAVKVLNDYTNKLAGLIQAVSQS